MEDNLRARTKAATAAKLESAIRANHKVVHHNATAARSSGESC